MNWITNFVRPRIKSLIAATRKSDTPENLWRKCPACGEMVFHRDLATAQFVCPQCGKRAGPNSHSVFPLIDIHFVVVNPQGPIEGADCRIHVAVAV